MWYYIRSIATTPKANFFFIIIISSVSGQLSEIDLLFLRRIRNRLISLFGFIGIPCHTNSIQRNWKRKIQRNYTNIIQSETLISRKKKTKKNVEKEFIDIRTANFLYNGKWCTTKNSPIRTVTWTTWNLLTCVQFRWYCEKVNFFQSKKYKSSEIHVKGEKSTEFIYGSTIDSINIKKCELN